MQQIVTMEGRYLYMSTEISPLSSATSFFDFAFKFFQQGFSCDLSLVSLISVEPLKRSAYLTRVPSFLSSVVRAGVRLTFRPGVP